VLCQGKRKESAKREQDEQGKGGENGQGFKKKVTQEDRKKHFHWKNEKLMRKGGKCTGCSSRLRLIKNNPEKEGDLQCRNSKIGKGGGSCSMACVPKSKSEGRAVVNYTPGDGECKTNRREGKVIGGKIPYKHIKRDLYG